MTDQETIHRAMTGGAAEESAKPTLETKRNHQCSSTRHGNRSGNVPRPGVVFECAPLD
jgi:hypothetical protein